MRGLMQEYEEAHNKFKESKEVVAQAKVALEKARVRFFTGFCGRVELR